MKQGTTLWDQCFRTNPSKKLEGVLREEGHLLGERELTREERRRFLQRTLKPSCQVCWLVFVKVTQEAIVVWEEEASKCLHQIVPTTKVTTTVATMVDQQSGRYE